MRQVRQAAIELNLKRPILIFLSKNGVFQFARRGTKEHARLTDGSIACASVNTLDEAEDLQIATCKLSYDGKLFHYHPFDQTIEGLIRAGRQIEQLYQHRKNGGVGWPEGWGEGAVENLSREIEHPND